MYCTIVLERILVNFLLVPKILLRLPMILGNSFIRHCSDQGLSLSCSNEYSNRTAPGSVADCQTITSLYDTFKPARRRELGGLFPTGTLELVNWELGSGTSCSTTMKFSEFSQKGPPHLSLCTRTRVPGSPAATSITLKCMLSFTK